MSALQSCVTLSSAALFAASVYHFMLHGQRLAASACWRHRAREILLAALHAGMLIGASWWWIESVDAPSPNEWSLCLIRSGMAGVLLMWLYRSPLTRERADDREGTA